MNPHKLNAFIYAAIAAAGGFVFGLDAALISGTIKFVTREFSLSDLQLGGVVSAAGLGVLFALPVAGYASNWLGRKKCLQIIAALYLISAIASSLAPSYGTLLAARFLGGFAFSSITLSSMYIGEIAPARWRGQLVAMIQINIVLGLSAAYFINYLILQAAGWDIPWIQNLGLDRHTWRWMLGAEILPAVFWFVLLAFVPRSPAWLLYKGRHDEAEKVLRKVFPGDRVEGKMEEMKESLRANAAGRSIRNQLQTIFSKPLRVTLIIGTTIAIAQQATGINAVLFYAPTVIEQLGIGTDAAFVQAIWIGIISVVFTTLSLFLIDRVGRRPMVVWGFLWIMISLGICSYGFSQARYIITEQAITELTDVPQAENLKKIAGREFGSDTEFKKALREVLGVEVARNHSSILLQKAASLNAVLILLGILSMIAAFQFSAGPVMWILFSELFPISIRGTAIPLFALITSITSYLIQQFFPWQLANMGGSAIFLFYAVMVGAGLLILYRFLPETKNLTIEEIQAKLSR